MRSNLEKTLKTFYWITVVLASLAALAIELFGGLGLLEGWTLTMIYWLLFAWFLGGVAIMSRDAPS